jgi:hypothetical protein
MMLESHTDTRQYPFDSHPAIASALAARRLRRQPELPVVDAIERQLTLNYLNDTVKLGRLGTVRLFEVSTPPACQGNGLSKNRGATLGTSQQEPVAEGVFTWPSDEPALIGSKQSAAPTAARRPTPVLYSV